MEKGSIGEILQDILADKLTDQTTIEKASEARFYRAENRMSEDRENSLDVSSRCRANKESGLRRVPSIA
ncbi:hypothetical protein NPIL_13941 [Nephila pilipes]|uniref:Uncharacterized protein n=1 Tax=Nephila pilipes TaxID=299642 RepID=A0A8X6JH69_NEPPI|nr:hypothetical protein NPIL_13941 [Nephila pilipes]